MKKLKLSFLLLSIAFVLCSCAGDSGDTVATVDSEIITEKEVLLVMASRMEKTEASEAEQREASIKSLVEDTLLSLEAQKEKITVTDSEVKSRIDGIFSADELGRLKNNYGISNEAVKRVVRKQIFKQKYMMDILGKKDGFIPTEEQLLDMLYNNYYKIQHIYINTSGMNSQQLEDARNDAQRILRKVRAGEEKPPEDNWSFSEYVFKEAELDEQLFQAVCPLQIDELSEVIEAQGGLHIIKRLPVKNSDMAEKEAELVNEYKRIYFESFVDELRQKYEISIDHDKLKKISVNTEF